MLRAFVRIPFLKVCAVTAAVACAGGGLTVDRVGSAGATDTGTAALVSLDHYLCGNELGHGGCDPTKVSLPNGTSFGISNPGSRFTCADGRFGHQGRPPATASVTNEFTTTPVSLAESRDTFGCSLLPAVQFPNARARTDVAALVTFTCTWVTYRSRTSARFTPPVPVTVAGDRSIRVLDPAALCVPNGATVEAPLMDLVCFETRTVNARRRNFFTPGLRLCVPSSPAGDPTPASSTTTTTTTTTTTQPPTTTTSGTQPCAGVIVGGRCIVNV
jgi:hypothetical protein